MNYYQTQKSGAPNSASSKNSSLLNQALLLVYFLAAVGAVVNLIGTNALATQGIVLDKLTSETQKIAKQNQNLRLEISQSGNLSYIESQAVKRGFKRIKTNLIISSPDAVAAAIQK